MTTNKKTKFLLQKFYHFGKNGWEIQIDELGKPVFPPEMKASERKDFRDYIKGLRVIFNTCMNKTFSEKVGEEYTGNKNSIEEKYDKIKQKLTTQNIIDLGRKTVLLRYIPYVDGSFGAYVEKL